MTSMSRLPLRVTNAAYEQVAATSGVSVAELKSWSRVKRIAHARQEVMWTLRQRGHSLQEIGRVMGGYDHTTIRHGCIEHDKRIGMIPNFIPRPKVAKSKPRPQNFRIVHRSGGADHGRLCLVEKPSKQEIWDVATAQAEALGIDPGDVLNGENYHAAVRARHRAWGQLRAAGYKTIAIAAAWGCGLRTVQRATSTGEARA